MTKEYINQEADAKMYISPGQEYEKQTLKSDFIFGKVMQDEELCKELLELLTGNEIEGIENLNSQMPIKVTNDSRGVRYDIYVEDTSANVYDAEIQQYGGVEVKRELPKRSRYYQGLMDLNLLESGGTYANLKNSYVVFICTFDPFEMKFCRYEFKNMCMLEQTFPLRDGRTILFFNSKGEIKNISKEIQAFLDYLETGQVSDEFTEKLDKAVEYARHNKEWKVEYMKSLLYEMDIRRRATREGLEEGREKSLIEQIVKKVQKNKSIDLIASELETTVEEISSLYEATLKCGPEYDVDQIYNMVNNKL